MLWSALLFVRLTSAAIAFFSKLENFTPYFMISGYLPTILVLTSNRYSLTQYGKNMSIKVYMAAAPICLHFLRSTHTIFVWFQIFACFCHNKYKVLTDIRQLLCGIKKRRKQLESLKWKLSIKRLIIMILICCFFLPRTGLRFGWNLITIPIWCLWR